jgi:hypothetical protein
LKKEDRLTAFKQTGWNRIWNLEFGIGIWDSISSIRNSKFQILVPLGSTQLACGTPGRIEEIKDASKQINSPISGYHATLC